MNIMQYITESEKHYCLRIKSVVEIDDAAMDRIETVLAKFQPLEFSRPKKTILQKHPLDFENVEVGEVWIVDAVFGLPASPSVVREDVRKVLDAPETYVVVRDQHEALEVETLRLNAVSEIEAEALEKGLKPAALLSSDPDYLEFDVMDEPLAGNDYNTSFLHYLGTIEDERKDARKKADDSLFAWMEPTRKLHKETEASEDYNADIEDAPTARPKSSPTKLPRTSMLGNLETIPKMVKKVYVDKTGKKVVLTRKLGE